MQIPFTYWQSYLFTFILVLLSNSASTRTRSRTKLHGQIELHAAGPKISSLDESVGSAQHSKRDVDACGLTPGTVGLCKLSGNRQLNHVC